MPRIWLKKALPNPQKILSHVALKGLGRLLQDPNLLHLNRRSVSVAVAIGLCVSFLPILGQMAIAASLAVLLRANLVISVILVWISNPLTMPVIFFWNYRVAMLFSDASQQVIVVNHDLEWWLNNIFRLWEDVMLGGVILGVVAGFLGFLLTRLAWRLSVMRNWHTRQLRLKLRKPRRHS
jgi:uncharacterized protein